jgi:hypothetical protein
MVPSVPLRLCVSKESHRTISPSMRGRLETRRHRDHKANSLPSSPIPPSGTIVWRRVATTMRSNLNEWFPPCLCASVFQKRVTEPSVLLCAVVWKHGGTEFTEQTANHLVPFHRLAKSGYDSGEEWLRRCVVTVMNGSPPYFCASVPLRLCVSNPPQKPTHLRFVYIDYPLFASYRTAFLPHRRNSQRCKPAAVLSKSQVRQAFVR